ncbi:phosphoadenylyl-sulfate reductase [Aciduricibacillus chroicocephali]|uniref:Adenosine 5'-phosphosulfate reductase n=1 Tax=Aciduricibacillus chroicocephali TaxID=3054939 RepID=A0ABY9KW99_9BACI|nr:phosphoadenylyl-sulfate reductase [Bacillaceae bacterium 44XB]
MAKPTYEDWHEEDGFAIDNATKGALNVLKWAYDNYDDELIYACSFGVEGVVMLDLITKAKADAKVVFLDTGLHFQETYELIDKVKERYPDLKIELKKPELTVEEQGEKFGEKLWEVQPNRCCYYRKVVPLQAVLSGATAWLSGLRRSQGPSRANTNFVNLDENFQSVKICPLIHWSWEDIWDYVKEHNLPYNPLHDQGYPSIGCAPCTLPGDGRDGRWAGKGKTECGLHIKQ